MSNLKTITCSYFIRKRWPAICCNGWRVFAYSHYGKLEIIWFSSTETTGKSSMVRKLRHSSFRQYPLGGAVFRVVNPLHRWFRLTGTRYSSIIKRCPGRPGLGTVMVKAKLSGISSDTHQIHYIPKRHFIIIIIIVDTVLRQKRNFKHEKQLSQQYRHIATLACTPG